MRHTTFFRSSASAVAVLAALAVAGAAAAQDDTTATVDSLIVTAQKREQNLQDVPVTVTSVSEALLQSAGVRDIKDLTILTPGLTVTSTTNETITSARIRGVGTVGDNPGLESSVGVVIDGVYRARNGVGFGDLGEMERIEVLKGPQGTLFGKNTSAGVINILTKAPSFEPGFNAELTAGNYDALGFSGSITGPIVEDKLAARLYVAHRERGGFYDVINGDGPRTRHEDQTQNFGTMRAQLLFLPTEAIELRATADYTTRREFCCTGVQIRSGPTAAIANALATGGQGVRPPGGATFPELPFSRTAYANVDTPQDVEDGGFSLQGDVDLPSLNGSLTSITAVRSWKSQQGMDVDFTGADILSRRKENYGFSVNTFSQEVRLAGETDRLNWLVGGFYASEKLKRADEYVYGNDYNAYFSLLLASQLGLSGTPIAPALVNCLTGNFPTCAAFGRVPGATFVPGPGFIAGANARDNYKQDSNSFAFFTNNSFKVTEQFEVTGGLRYTSEDKDVLSVQTNSPGSSTACATAISRINSPQWNAGIPLASQPAIAGALCTNWANPAFNNRTTSQSITEEQWSGTVKGAYRFNDDIMAYGSYARGYKAGGFNLDRQTTNLAPDASTAFPAETVDSYELGVKTTWLGNRLLLNATGFIQQFKDFQLNTFAGVAFIVESIPELESKGVDVDLIWFNVLPGLNFQGGVTYAKTEYGTFTAADLMVPGRFPSLSLLPGSQMSFAPEWSSSAAIDYTHDIGSALKAKFSLSAKYMSEYNTGSDLLPFKRQEGYTLVNGRILLAQADDRWSVELWGQNLGDTEYKQVAYNGPIQGTFFQSTVTATGPYAGSYYNPALDTGTYDAFLGQPRTYGVTLRTKF